MALLMLLICDVIYCVCTCLWEYAICKWAGRWPISAARARLFGGFFFSFLYFFNWKDNLEETATVVTSFVSNWTPAQVIRVNQPRFSTTNSTDLTDNNSQIACYAKRALLLQKKPVFYANWILRVFISIIAISISIANWKPAPYLNGYTFISGLICITNKTCR